MGFTFKKYRELKKELEKKEREENGFCHPKVWMCGISSGNRDVKDCSGVIEKSGQAELLYSMTFQPHMSSNV